MYYKQMTYSQLNDKNTYQKFHDSCESNTLRKDKALKKHEKSTFSKQYVVYFFLSFFICFSLFKVGLHVVKNSLNNTKVTN